MVLTIDLPTVDVLSTYIRKDILKLKDQFVQYKSKGGKQAITTFVRPDILRILKIRLKGKDTDTDEKFVKELSFINTVMLDVLSTYIRKDILKLKDQFVQYKSKGGKQAITTFVRPDILRILKIRLKGKDTDTDEKFVKEVLSLSGASTALKLWDQLKEIKMNHTLNETSLTAYASEFVAVVDAAAGLDTLKLEICKRFISGLYSKRLRTRVHWEVKKKDTEDLDEVVSVAFEELIDLKEAITDAKEYYAEEKSFKKPQMKFKRDFQPKRKEWSDRFRKREGFTPKPRSFDRFQNKFKPSDTRTPVSKGDVIKKEPYVKKETLKALSVSSGGLPTLNVSVWGSKGDDFLNTIALLDTGCSHSVISDSLLARLQETQHIFTKPEYAEIRLASGKIESKKSVLLTLKIDQAAFKAPLTFTEEFLVINMEPETQHNLILSYTIINELKLMDLLELDSKEPKYDEDDEPEIEEDEEEDHLNEGTLFCESPLLRPEIQPILEDYEEKEKGFELGEARVEEFHITLEDESKTIRIPPRRLSYALRKQVQEIIADLLEQGKIIESHSSFSSPIVMVKKKDGSWRLCVDFRELNKITLPLQYPLPRIRDLLDVLTGVKYFALLDLQSGFHQIKVDEVTRPYTAFVTPDGFYEWVVLPFGLRNAPSHFQKAMNLGFADLLFTSCLIYIDDIMIFGKTKEEFIENLRKVFERLISHGLKLNKKKCRIGCTEVDYLGFHLNQMGRSISPKRIQSLLDLPPPTTKKEVRQVIGLLNYFREFIPNYSLLTSPITSLIDKTISFEWTEECQQSFDKIKAWLKDSIILAYPDPEATFILKTDASDVAVGGVLSQIIEGKERYISFFSKKLTKQQQRWTTGEKEAFAVVHGVKYNKEFDFEIHHVPGRDNVVADTLSRLVPKDESLMHIEMNDLLTRKIMKDQEALTAAEKDSLELHDGLWLDSRGRIVLSKTSPLKEYFLRKYHGIGLKGHQGISKTLSSLDDAMITWKNRTRDVDKYVKSCLICQKLRFRYYGYAIRGTTAAFAPFESISMDSMGYLDESSSGYKYILVIVDNFTKYTCLIPMVSTTAREAADAIITRICLPFTVPQTLITDGDTQFKNDLVRSICETCGIDHHITTPYHPQSNGLVERKNLDVMKALKAKIMEGSPKESWDKLLPFVEHKLNSMTSETTGFSPNVLLFGNALYEGRTPLSEKIASQMSKETFQLSRKEATVQYMRELDLSFKLVHSLAKERTERIVKQRIMDSPSPKEGDYVACVLHERYT
ncbi:Transposon Tf2-9 polyprotein [Aduncisulcus paluster]|uniref:Transposon Tf2-9 polyprotein n=1 Tax=Aduncisulcus paluster TaxID=2918883 RepID=A0ABQ5JYG1_9EUKA|nr:Transposon Tf2-9 polyprotein [Aduncisulcus paluster]